MVDIAHNSLLVNINLFGVCSHLSMLRQELQLGLDQNGTYP